MQQHKYWYILSITLALVLAALSCEYLTRLTAAHSPSSLHVDPAWCDKDGDGFCPTPIWSDCNDDDPLIHPNAEEQADFIDNNCNGFGDEPPIGFVREDYSMQGAGSAVAWYEEYIYLAAMSVLQIYHAPPGVDPALKYEIEFRDWAREIMVDGDTLFVAARGDGLYAFDLANDPAQPELAGRVSGLMDAGGNTNIEAVFNGVYARDGKVAVARANTVRQNQGGVDVIVFDYNAATHTFTPVNVIGTEVRSKSTREIPIAVALTEHAGGLYIGYGDGLAAGELVYVPLDTPGGPTLHADFGATLDIAMKGDTAFVAFTNVATDPQVRMLSRFSIVNDTLVEEPIVTNPGSSAGVAVDVDGDLLCFGTMTPGRFEDGYNLWAFNNLEGTPTRIGAAGTPDWIYQLACRDSETGPDWIYVADEWGGLEMWQSNGITLTLDLDHHRIPTGALSLAMWNDGSRVYSAKKGAGLWVFDESDPRNERVAVEWIDVSDPGCSCPGCCPPEFGPRPYPPAVFITAGVSRQGQVALIARDRNTAAEGDGYFMVFAEDTPSDGEYECIYSDPFGPAAEPFAATWGGNMAVAHGEILFAAVAAQPLRLYQHCSGEADPVRFLGEIETESTGSGLEFADVAVYQDYLFVAEAQRLPMSEPNNGRIHVYRWNDDNLALCPAQAVLDPPAYLGYFAGDFIPRQLEIDPTRNQLIVASSAALLKDGALLFFDLNSFDPNNPAEMDDHYVIASPDDSIRVTRPNIWDILLDDDTLYVVDFDNGLYQYSLNDETYLRFYPAHGGTTAQTFEPQMVQSPEGVIPLHHPLAVALTPSGKVMVQENVSGRVAILQPQSLQTGPNQIYLPVVTK